MGSISLLKHIRLNNIDVLCLHIFVSVLSSCRISVMKYGPNWLINL